MLAECRSTGLNHPFTSIYGSDVLTKGPKRKSAPAAEGRQRAQGRKA